MNTPQDPFRRPSDRLARAGLDDLERLPVWALLDNVRSVGNVGSMFRTADAAGLAGLYLAGVTATPPRPDMEKTALGATETVPWDYWPDPVACVRALQARGVTVAAVEQTPAATDLEAWAMPFPCCFVVGHEVRGVTPEVLEAVDAHVEIPMHGAKRSLNVAVSFGVVAFAARARWRRTR
ncbi:MAG TPA: TrmH family RNA methyltransferase [Candidatus Krumholzibacteria bacterium]|nr:TrmH family RNA methyltransferase [Candidatus Krumholzibacteria bacterium]HRX51159.1 TrmH family RNA methyltransferase [Candidatus Krumholzibacteria bacterium]